MKSSIITVPIASLTVSQDQSDSGQDSSGGFSGEDVAPAMGDKVEFTVSGTVTSIDGENAQITPDSINGDPIGKSDTNPNTADNLNDAGSGGSTDMETHLRTMAAKHDDEEGDN